MPQVYTKNCKHHLDVKMVTRPLSSKGQRRRATALSCKMIALLLLSTYQNRDTRFLSVARVKRLSLLPSITFARPSHHSFSISNQPISRFENVSEATAFEAREESGTPPRRLVTRRAQKQRVTQTTKRKQKKAQSPPHSCRGVQEVKERANEIQSTICIVPSPSFAR